MNDEEMLVKCIEAGDAAYKARTELAPPDALHQYQRFVLLQTLDQQWREHLGTLDHLRQGIHLRGYAQKNPRQEYKREGFELFGAMLETVKLEVTRTFMRVQVKSAEQVEQAEAQAEQVTNVQYQHADYTGQSADEALAVAAHRAPPKPNPFVKPMGKIGRNDPVSVRLGQEVQAMSRHASH